MIGDIALLWDNDLGGADIGIGLSDLVQDGGLETAVVISLFTDRRADDTDQLPPGETSRRGWWGDVYPEVQEDKIGSKLWLLQREKTTRDIPTRAKAYVEEALAWLIDDKVAKSVEVVASLAGEGTLLIQIAIEQPDGLPVTYRYNYNWAAEAAKRAA